jgi:hypothetical protein
MVSELPHVNVLTKCDLLQAANRATLESIIEPDVTSLIAKVNSETSGSHKRLNEAIGRMVCVTTCVCWVGIESHSRTELCRIVLLTD